MENSSWILFLLLIWDNFWYKSSYYSSSSDEENYKIRGGIGSSNCSCMLVFRSFNKFLLINYDLKIKINTIPKLSKFLYFNFKIPDYILNDDYLNKSIENLPKHYNFEIHKSIHRIIEI